MTTINLITDVCEVCEEAIATTYGKYHILRLCQGCAETEPEIVSKNTCCYSAPRGFHSANCKG